MNGLNQLILIATHSLIYTLYKELSYYSMTNLNTNTQLKDKMCKCKENTSYTIILWKKEKK